MLYDIFVYILVSVFVYLLARFLWFVFTLIVFKYIIDHAIDKIVDETDKISKKKKEDYKPDLKYRDKEREIELVRVEKIEKEKQQEQDNFEELSNNRAKIVGVVKLEKLGKFTSMMAKRMGLDLQRINLQTLQEKGYFQAKLEAERGAAMGQGMGSGRQQGRS